MNITAFVGVGSVLAIGAIYGLYAWTKHDLDKVTAERDAAQTAQACVSATAEDINKNLLQRVTSLTADVERQKRIAIAHEKKSLERLKQFNDLQRKIANVPQSQNVPVSDHLERVLDELRRPVARDGGPPADRPDADTDGDDASSTGSGVPADPVPAS